MKSVGWQPIIVGDFGSRVFEFLNKVFEHETEQDSSTSSCIALSERSLLLSYFVASDLFGVSHSNITKLLNLLSDRLTSKLNSSLFHGLGAVGWIVEHVSNTVLHRVFEDSCHDDPLEDLEKIIIKRVESTSWSGSFDLVDGLVGIGVFFLERWPRETAQHGLRLILAHLERMMDESAIGIVWRTTPEMMLQAGRREAFPMGYYNLGVAHGLPGVIGFLTMLFERDVERDRVDYLLTGSIRWLLANNISCGSSRYCPWLAAGHEHAPSRVSWCYGDLGIAAVLSYVARSSHRDRLEIEVDALLASCLRRLTEPIDDSGLCHGQIGVAHIYNRLYQLNDDPTLKDAALHYFSTGFEKLVSEPIEPVFLRGSVGSALALLSAMHPIKPHWDRRLLLSSRITV